MSNRSKLGEFKILRRISAAAFAITSIALASVLLVGEAYYGQFPTWSFAVMGLAVAAALFGAAQFWSGKSYPALIASIVAALLITIPTYQFTLPSMTSLLLSKRIKNELQAHGIDTLDGELQILSAQFTEPSLVYRLGTHIMLGRPEERLANLNLRENDLVLLDRERKQTSGFEQKLAEILLGQKTCLHSLHLVKGFNYAKGDPVNLEIMQVKPCPSSQANGL